MTVTDVAVPIKAEEDIVLARRAGREMARVLGFRSVDQSRLATAISELARNILRYAETGEVLIHPTQNARGIEIVARDEGPGIRNVDLAMEDGYTSGQGLGIGLPGTRRLVDEMDVQSELGQGTTVTIRKWLR